jgi:hypothetical protein
MGRMKLLAISVVALVAALGSSALAQSASRWEAPGHIFSLDFQAWGWSALPPNPGDDPTRPMLLGIEHRQFQQAGSMRTCFVTERRFPSRPGVSQETLNALATQSDGRLDIGMPVSLTRVNVDGVTVNDAVYDHPIYQHMRWFFIPSDASVLQIHINCGATGAVPDDVQANISNMLQTLHIGSGS